MIKKQVIIITFSNTMKFHTFKKSHVKTSTTRQAVLDMYAAFRRHYNTSLGKNSLEENHTIYNVIINSL